jgi:hypothetical protein
MGEFGHGMGDRFCRADGLCEAAFDLRHIERHDADERLGHPPGRLVETGQQTGTEPAAQRCARHRHEVIDPFDPEALCGLTLPVFEAQSRKWQVPDGCQLSVERADGHAL